MDNPLVAAAQVILNIKSPDQGDGDQERLNEAVKIYQAVTGVSEEVARESISKLSQSDRET